MEGLKISLKYIRHHLTARRWDSFHSPNLFELFTYCCIEKKWDPPFDRIEQQRKKLLQSKEKISRTDFGAGSHGKHTNEADSISHIAKRSLSLPFQCRFLSRFAERISPLTILEFGTSFGISTAYLSTGCPGSKIVTIEGDPAIAAIASEIFVGLQLKNIELINNTFEEYLALKISEKKPIDLFFLDGNHRRQAVLDYFNALKSSFHHRTIIVVDDIYWSDDMQQGWQELISQPEITQSVDCFLFGILFFDPVFRGKVHHKIRLPFSSMWRIRLY